MTSTRGRGFESAAIHSGDDHATAAVPVISPIFQSSTFVVDSIENYGQDHAYSRVSNPNRSALAQCLAELEGGDFGFAFSSGLAAEDTIIRVICKPGDHVLVSSDVYGGTFRLFAEVLSRWGVTFTAVSLDDLSAARAAVRSNTTLIWAESLTNPTLRVSDIRGLAEIAHAAGARLVVDNTFSSPYLQQPLNDGADVVVHSTTKYIGGHSDVVGGALVTSDPDIAQRTTLYQKTMGGVAGPFDAWLTLRGVKTLAVRMERHCDNAEKVVEFLTSHPAVEEVFYPGLPSHPAHEVAARQMRRFGGMVSFRPRGGEPAAVHICESTTMFKLAVSLGGVESLIELPGRMTHSGSGGSAFAAPTDLVRLSVGIESLADILADLDQVLAGIEKL